MKTQEFRRLFSAALEALRLPATFKPYSLHRGGATFHFKTHGRIDWTMDVGRCPNQRTCGIYVNTVMLELTHIK